MSTEEEVCSEKMISLARTHGQNTENETPPRPKGNHPISCFSPLNMQCTFPYFPYSGWGTRFTMITMTFFGKALCYAARVDMSVAIVAMVDRSKLRVVILCDLNFVCQFPFQPTSQIILKREKSVCPRTRKLRISTRNLNTSTM